ncbi:hypothetical protein ANME2D_02371 [Candidatus Methanoperedens nitroreducens]|uniref:Poly(3-hydroxyalkanoate) polymerase subunit PhaE n=1 Tax=Candidatus Methanoperedens nitratireducens TaxID=1392998 RepID=A0A062UXB5_9EURY|nr:cell envelope integrity protein TolA [Candidatus Methanoperedens nitroreducens]KCZ71636.1 hypothetical protein ANME2D_02371 [Candidatus Methanoperedens nitroreducens]MDJ1421264.1 cell envelope integrity protein TolA [Candidatus Methanoperedens sp.]
MARKGITSEFKRTGEEMESQKGMREEQTAGRGTLATPSSWWVERLKIERPRPEDQEPRYRKEQERYAQERQRAAYYRPIQEVERPRAEEQEPRYREEQKRYEPGKQMRAERERYEPEKQMREEGEERKDIFRIWADSYDVVSRMWEDTYINLYKPWIESTEEMYSKAAELSRNATPDNYRAFYDQWIKTYQNSFGKFYPVMTRQFDRETIEKLMNSAEESRKLFQSWAAMLEENSRKTQELLQGTPDPEKYREFYDIWMRTYGKIYEEFAEMTTKGSTREVLEAYGGIPGMYLNNFVQMSKIWNESYMYLFRPWLDSMVSLSEKMAELSRGEARPEAYREFYDTWMDTYRKTYGRLFDIQSARSTSEEMVDSFMRSMTVYKDMSNSWIDAMEKMSQRTMDISKRTTEPEAYKGFYDTWVNMYERAFDDFFRYVPMAGPMRSMMEPAKNAARVYTDIFSNMSNMWMRSVFGSASRT